MPVLVIAEHNNNALNAATYPVIGAALQLESDVHVLVAGSGSNAAAQEAAKVAGVSKVLHADNPVYAHPLAENLAALIVTLAGSYSHILAPATFFGKNVLPRASALVDVQQISDITAINDKNTFVRPVYAGNVLETVQTSDTPVMLTVRPTAFDAAGKKENAAPVETIGNAGDCGLSRFVGQELSKSERPDLATAKIVISGGRGLGSGENFKTYLEPVADRLQAAIGASRAAVDAGYVPNDLQVGQTGKVVAPQLYIAVGISGAIQHLAGMKDSKVIVAINKDPEAPIFSIADYSYVGDLFQALKELDQALSA